MAIIADYSVGSNVIKNAYIKLDKIWISKAEGFKAWVNVYTTTEDKLPVGSFTIHTDYVEGKNPFKELYKALGDLSFLTNVKHDNKPVKGDLNNAVIDELPNEVNPVTIKESKKKK